VPFCPKCNAPQIRVSVPMPMEAEAERVSPEDSTASALPATRSTGSEKVDWRFARSRAAIAAAAFLLVTLFVPVLGFFIVSIPLCGVLAVYLYHRGRASSVSIGAGIRMGMVAGVFAFLLLMLLGAGQAAFTHFAEHRSVMAEMQTELQKAVNSNPNPQAREMGQAFLTPDGVKILISFGVVLTFGMFLVLCGIGGAVGAALLGRADKS
jgi:hypothetical protein